MDAVMTMSAIEVFRFDTLIRVQRRELWVEDAMALLALARRQVFRLLGRLRDDGPGGLISRKRGRPGNRRFDDTFRRHVSAIVRERYVDLGPTLAAEYLADQREAQQHRAGPQVVVIRRVRRSWGQFQPRAK